MDPLIKDTLAEIKTDLKDGFKSVGEQIKNLVTRGEFQAVIERIDSQHQALRRDFDTHEGKTDGIVSESRSDLQRMNENEAAAHNAIRKELADAIGDFKASNRWAIGLSISAVGILFTIITWFITHF